MGRLTNKFKEFIGFKEILTLNLWRALLAETVVSAIYLFIICGQSVPLQPDMPISRLHGALTVAFSVSCLASAFWEISGGHFNPSVSLAMLMLKKISLCRFVLYVAAQCLGSEYFLYYGFQLLSL